MFFKAFFTWGKNSEVLTLHVFEDLNILVLLDWMIGGTWGLGDRRPGKLVANWFAGRILVFDPTILVSGHWPDIVCWLAGGLADWQAGWLVGWLAGSLTGII